LTDRHNGPPPPLRAGSAIGLALDKQPDMKIINGDDHKNRRANNSQAVSKATNHKSEV